MVLDGRVQRDTMPVSMSDAMLQGTKQTLGTWDPNGHATKFTYNLVPLLQTDAAAVTEVIKDLQQTEFSVLREL